MVICRILHGVESLILSQKREIQDTSRILHGVESEHPGFFPHLSIM
ncbi:hypothetical protein Mcup_1123 [Metallosphaera cuprina Ar-4]|uniref:Uncharacterized protein n=1 Tax=Metallosphaera cuprina (strain Ar-4) TaxID=1006006 RepID=F4G330_METCR|nr:hypothetical protein Mcup_1123 [Metallosphaera cuprina Ar-4]